MDSRIRSADGQRRDAGQRVRAVALGFSMVYGILKLLNFAHGDVMMVGAFVGWGALNWLGGAESPSVAVWILIVLLVAGGDGGMRRAGVVIERFAYRPLRQAPRIAPLISALGVSFFLQNSVLSALRGRLRSYDTYFLWSTSTSRHRLGRARVWTLRLLVIGGAARDDARCSACLYVARGLARRCGRRRTTARRRR